MNKHAHMETIWLFDVDKTLYPPKNGLYQEGNARINHYLQKHLQISLLEINKLRKHYMRKYGTSLLGSIKECGLDGNDFLQFVHSFPKHSFLAHQTDLRTFLENLPGKKYIFSNAPKDYILEILSIVGIDSVFSKIYDIHSFRFHGKPNTSSYLSVLRWIKAHPHQCILVDDMKINCTVASKLGIQTIWIDENQLYNDYYKEVLMPRLTKFLKSQK
jgi:putative hydrolase of the HAD superfamily